MYGSQPKLSSVVESSLTWDLFLGFYSQDFDLRQQSQWSLEKAAKIWGRHHWFLPKMTFGSDCRNFILATSCVTTQIWVVLLIAIFPWFSTNQKHYPVVMLKNVGCFLRLSDGCSVQLMQGCDAAGCSHVGRHRPWCRHKQLLLSYIMALFLWRQIVMGRRDISLQNVVNCLREKQKVSLAWRVTRPAEGRVGDHISLPQWFCTLLKMQQCMSQI